MEYPLDLPAQWTSRSWKVRANDMLFYEKQAGETILRRLLGLGQETQDVEHEEEPPAAEEEPRQNSFSGVRRDAVGQVKGLVTQTKSQIHVNTADNQDSAYSSNSQILSVPNFIPEGPPLTPKTGDEIMQGLIASFLAHQPLERSEEECLKKGTGALGGQAVQVSQNIFIAGKQVLAMKASGPSSASRSPAQSKVSGISSEPAEAMQKQQVVNVMHGRRLKPIDESHASILDKTEMMLALGMQLEEVAKLGHNIMSQCLQSDGKDTLKLAAQNAKNLKYLEHSLLSHGVDALAPPSCHPCCDSVCRGEHVHHSCYYHEIRNRRLQMHKHLQGRRSYL